MKRRSIEELIAELLQLKMRCLNHDYETMKEHNRMATRICDLYVQLRCRGDEGVKAVDALIDHPHPGVRLLIASWMYWLHPDKSVAVLREIGESGPWPLDADARMELRRILDYNKWEDIVNLPRHREKYQRAMKRLAEQGKK